MSQGSVVLTASWTHRDALQLWDIGTCRLIKSIPCRLAQNDDGEYMYSCRFCNNNVVTCAGSGTSSVQAYNVNSNEVTNILLICVYIIRNWTPFSDRECELTTCFSVYRWAWYRLCGSSDGCGSWRQVTGICWSFDARQLRSSLLTELIASSNFYSRFVAVRCFPSANPSHFLAFKAL